MDTDFNQTAANIFSEDNASYIQYVALPAAMPWETYVDNAKDTAWDPSVVAEIDTQYTSNPQFGVVVSTRKVLSRATYGNGPDRLVTNNSVTVNGATRTIVEIKNYGDFQISVLDAPLPESQPFAKIGVKPLAVGDTFETVIHDAMLYSTKRVENGSGILEQQWDKILTPEPVTVKVTNIVDKLISSAERGEKGHQIFFDLSDKDNPLDSISEFEAVATRLGPEGTKTDPRSLAVFMFDEDTGHIIGIIKGEDSEPGQELANFSPDEANGPGIGDIPGNAYIFDASLLADFNAEIAADTPSKAEIFADGILYSSDNNGIVFSLSEDILNDPEFKKAVLQRSKDLKTWEDFRVVEEGGEATVIYSRDGECFYRLEGTYETPSE